MKTLADIQKQAILERIVQMDYNVVAAARSLGFSKTQTYRKIKQWGLSPIDPARVKAELNNFYGQWVR